MVYTVKIGSDLFRFDAKRTNSRKISGEAFVYCFDTCNIAPNQRQQGNECHGNPMVTVRAQGDARRMKGMGDHLDPLTVHNELGTEF